MYREVRRFVWRNELLFGCFSKDVGLALSFLKLRPAFLHVGSWTGVVVLLETAASFGHQAEAGFRGLIRFLLFNEAVHCWLPSWLKAVVHCY